MSLSDEQVEALLAGELNKKKSPQDTKAQLHLSRIKTQFPSLPMGSPVTWHDTFTPNKSLHCSSRGCTCPTPYKFKGIPYCSLHLIVLLVLELQRSPKQEEMDETYISYSHVDGGPIAIAEYPSDRITTEGLL